VTPLFRRRPQRSSPAPPAPFVVGVGRSGTTLLRLMLDAHPALAIPPESHFIPDLATAGAGGPLTPEAAVEVISSVRQWGDFGFTREELLSALHEAAPLDTARAVRAFFGAYAARHGKERWGDKTPIYVESMPAIAAAVPEARFIHLIRDGRAVALSRSTWSEGEAPDPVKAARRWKRRINRARGDARGLPHYIEARYEDLVLDTEATLRRVCEFVELEYDGAMLSYHERAEERLSELGDLPAGGGKGERAGEDRLAIHELTKEPPKRERVARWKAEMSPQDQASYEAEAGDLLAELGYETASGLAS
jgi:hypothetical protein